MNARVPMRAALLLPFLCASTAIAAAAPDPIPVLTKRTTVVFVCEKGVAKSLIAATLFEQRAKARGLPFHAISRGMKPQPEVPPIVREKLTARGRDLSGYRAAALSADDASGALRVVSFDQDVAAVVKDMAPIDRWDGLPPATLEYAAFEAEVAKRVEALLDSLH